jgi:hypothetical protein
MHAFHRTLVLMLVAAACVPAGPPPGPPPSAQAQNDPIGFLLERRDSLDLSDSVTFQLSRLNLRLFSRNRPLQFQVDTALYRVRGSRAPRPGEEMPPEVRERLEPLLAQIRANTAAARDTAWAMLTAEQREKAERLQARADSVARRGGPPTRRR